MAHVEGEVCVVLVGAGFKSSTQYIEVSNIFMARTYCLDLVDRPTHKLSKFNIGLFTPTRQRVLAISKTIL